MNTKQTALDAYLVRAAAIHAKLAHLQQLADDHFGHDHETLSTGSTLATSGGWTPRSTTCWRSSAANRSETMTMITLQKLTTTQSTIIRSAARHPEGWIVEAGDSHLLTDAGYATIGKQRPSPPPTIDDSPARDSVQPCRLGTKLAKVVAALQKLDWALQRQVIEGFDA